MCVCVLKRQIDGGCDGSESGGETLILIMNQIFYSKKKKKKNYESNLKVSVFLLNPHFKTLFF